MKVFFNTWVLNVTSLNRNRLSKLIFEFIFRNSKSKENIDKDI
jgi:hypothetical protein